MAAAQTRRQPQNRTALPAARPAPLQPENGPRLPSQGSVSATLGLQLRHLGGKVPRRVVPAGDALVHRTDEEDRPLTARSPRTDPELFPCPETTFQRRRRGSE